jgi:REP element-mobilizing transposase RayT
MTSVATQLPLPLRPRGRGGWRKGAGRKAAPDAAVRHLSRTRFRNLPAHVTVRVQTDLPSLRTVALVHEIERRFAGGCDRPGFRLVHYSLQGNHAHLIVEAQDRDALGRGMKAIGARLARAVNRIADRDGRVFADRYHARLLRTPREVRNALRYVLLNARRHSGAKTASAPLRLDPASSARLFDGWKYSVPSALDHARSADGVPVARARLWLVTIGWRRHGLLDPGDVPGPAPPGALRVR